jgi:hypothetical protein
MRSNLKKGFLVVGIILTVLIVSSIFLHILANKNLKIEEGGLVYFYSKTCSACGLMTPFVESLESEVNVIYMDISSNSNFFRTYLEEHNIPWNEAGVPAIFIGNHSFIGYSEQNKQAILQVIAGEELSNKEKDFEDTIRTEILGFWDVEFSLKDKTLLFSTILLGFLDSLNICSLTVLVFLIIFTLSIGSAKRALKSGMAFSIVIFLFYFSFMLFLTSLISSLSLRYGLHIRLFVILITILAGFLLIKDYFFYGKGISLRIPVSAKPLLERYMKKATLSSVIILGILASIVELPCTINFPLAYSTLLTLNMVSGISRVLWIALYNLIYILPLLFIVLGTYFSWININDIDQKIQNNKKTIKLISGLVLLLIALYFAWPLIFV